MGIEVADWLRLVLPAYLGLLHVWLYLQRRREAVHRSLGAAALAAVGWSLASFPPFEGFEAAPSARTWLALACAIVFLPLAQHAIHAFLGLRRPHLERVAWTLAGAALLAVALAAAAPGTELARALLGDLGRGAVSAAGGALAIRLALLCPPAARRPRDRVAAAAVVAPWLAAAIGDIAACFDLRTGSAWMPWGVLPALAAASGLLLGRLVRSMAEAERLASDLNRLVEERSAELRRKELQLAHGEPLASLGALAAGVARATHEPIALLAAHVTRLGSVWHRAECADEVRVLLAECRDGVEQLRAIVSQVLAVARRSGDAMEPVDLSAVVASVLPIVQPLARERAQIRSELAPVPPVLGDRRLLGQVALQLLLNAVQSIPPDDRARHEVCVSTEQVEGMVRLRVEDSGPGIPLEILPRVFDPFFTPEEGQRAPALGLAVTHQIVARHRGRVEVASDRNGTRVTVEIPPAVSVEDPREA
jgi:signal transduction histidine kinase